MSLHRDPNCELCPLHETATNVCIGPRFSRKPEPGWHPKILFVGEAPGAEEDREGKPFVGPAGQLLDYAIKTYGITNYAITNVLGCRPPENRKPRAKEIQACYPYLKAEIERFQPEIVVPLGAVALKRVCGYEKITEYAGRVIEPPGRDYKVFPVIHPAAVLRMEERFKQPFEAQMRGLARLAKGEKPTPTAYVKVSLNEAVKRLKKLAEDEGPYGFDVETGTKESNPKLALNPKFNFIVTAAFSSVKGEAWWFEWPEVPPVEFYEAFRDLLDSKATMVAHNATMEVKQILWHVVNQIPYTDEEDRAEFSQVRWNVEDSLLFYYLLHEDAKGTYDLDSVRLMLCPDMPDYSRAVLDLVNDGKRHQDIDLDVLGPYNAGDADACLRIANRLRPQIMEKKGLKRAWEQVVRPSIFTVSLAELNGRKIDFDRVGTLHDEFLGTQRDASLKMTTHPVVARYCKDTGRELAEWNPNSAKQVAPIIFDYLKLPAIGKTDGGDDSIKATYLEPFRAKSKFVKNYLRWKEARTLDNNYLLPYTQKAAPDGFLYGGYLLFGTSTGRLASVNPNLQNFAPKLREVVVSRFPGGKFVSADFSQVELRLMALESGCKRLLEAYENNENVHAVTAAEVASHVFGKTITLAEILEQHEAAEKAHEDSWRQEYGKRPNFALLYGAWAKRFSEEFHVPFVTAGIIYRAWHGLYPEVSEYLRSLEDRIRERGWLESRMGRRRRLPLGVGNPPEHSSAYWTQKAAFREGGNFPIQSLASDLNTMAAARVVEKAAVKGIPALLLGMTHDSQDYDVPADAVDDFCKILRPVMVEETHALFPWLTVPLEIDIKVGDSWGTLAKWKTKEYASGVR